MTASDYITVQIHSPLASSTKQVPASFSWQQMLHTLEQITGIEPQFQHITVNSQTLNPDLLAPIGLRDGSVLAVTPLNDQSIVAELSQHDASAAATVVSPQMSTQQYLARSNNARDFVQRQRLNQFTPGTRVQLVEDPSRGQGTVRFAGAIQELGNRLFVGVEWDAAVGKNNGSIGQTQYFSCAPQHGSFVPPGKLQLAELSTSGTEQSRDRPSASEDEI